MREKWSVVFSYIDDGELEYCFSYTVRENLDIVSHIQ